jgi:hypothetical protein
MFGSDMEPLLPPTAIPMENSFTKRSPAQEAMKRPVQRPPYG